jgi:hypothetical protein
MPIISPLLKPPFCVGWEVGGEDVGGEVGGGDVGREVVLGRGREDVAAIWHTLLTD